MKTTAYKILEIVIVLGVFLGICSCNNSTRNGAEDNSDTSQTALIQDSAEDSDTIIQMVSYPLIIPAAQIPGTIDDTLAANLPEHIRALAAFYSAMGGSDCDGENCGLTSALKLGKQGSEQHKALIRDYFPGDKVAETVLDQNCYLRPSGASSFSEFAFLTIRDYGDSLSVDYELFQYNRGQAERTKGPDIYRFEDDTFENEARNIWTFVGDGQ
ncbi:hypothetical protein HP439_04110 [Sphingobacterium shayense]|uniref:hypothetical protein n=1 Tax=Sphingobacterium shayense TaxID=626343 RepID=UPI001555B935|nr:hypothetical protein [Sphingobacterium shayense]NQD69906.1 hypothetical protein [Sphingobacterium shayense]